MKSNSQKAFAFYCGAAIAILITGTMSLIDARSANAKPEFAA